MQYPSGIKKIYKSEISYGNRGMILENALNETNEYYLLNNIAVIYKKPTPITIKKVDYPNRIEAVIREAYFKTPSTTDYNGLYKGKYIDFEAKETRNKSFPLANIHEHQIKHLRRINEQGGISFLIILFTKLNEIYLLKTSDFLIFLNVGRKSIPYEYIKKHGFKIKEKYNPRIDYLKIVDHIIEEEENEKYTIKEEL